MGLAKQEIDTRIDEIIGFSELGDFIDQPLRTYSSGMIVRPRIFCGVVNVDADILIVDEALAVGDAIFPASVFQENPGDAGSWQDHFICGSRYRSGEESLHICIAS
ncbi:MAG: hypothetical protein MZV63_12285 [Marinilabiliales bacterium]|nr:hypothetical protein [Marinilabiliales bacterium]